MSGRHQPENGADSAAALETRLYRCKMLDLEGPAFWIEVRAIGRNDAREQARTQAEEQGADRPGVLRVEEVAHA